MVSVEERNARILDAATAIFLQAGYSGARMSMIASKAGCSLETLYTAYPHKAELFTALTMRQSSGLFEAVGPLSIERDPAEVLLRFATAVLELMMRPETIGLHRLVIGESRSFPELGEGFWREGPGRGHKVLTEYFAARQSLGLLPIKSPSHAAEVFLGLVVGSASMRCTLGVRTFVEDKEKQSVWAEYAVNLMVTMLEKGMV